MRILKRVDVRSWIYSRALVCEQCTSVFKVEHDYEFKAFEAEAQAEVECPVCKHKNIFSLHNTLPDDDPSVEEESTNPVEPAPPLTPPKPPVRS